MRRLFLLLLVVLAGCGSSGSTIIDAHNAKTLEPSRAASPLRDARGASVTSRGLELGSPSGRLTVRAVPGTVRLLDARSGATIDTLISGIAQPTAIAWTHDSTTFAVGGKEGEMTVWEEFKYYTYDLSAGRSRVTALAFSPDMRLLASGQRDGGARIWDLGRRKEVASLGPTFVITHLRFSADGRRLLLAGNDTSTWQLTLPR